MDDIMTSRDRAKVIEELCEKLNNYEPGSTDIVRDDTIKDDYKLLKHILNYGEFIRIPTDYEFITLNSNSGCCHYLSSKFVKDFSKYSSYRLVTGYAFSRDYRGNNGQWVRHSWVVDELDKVDNLDKYRITEMAKTTRREIYYGIPLSDYETEKFRRRIPDCRSYSIRSSVYHGKILKA